MHHDLVPRDFPSHFLRISPGDEAFWFISFSFSTELGDLNEQVFLSKEIMLVWKTLIDDDRFTNFFLNLHLEIQ